MDTEFTGIDKVYRDPSGVWHLNTHKKLDHAWPPIVDPAVLAGASRSMSLFLPAFEDAILKEGRQGRWVPVTRVTREGGEDEWVPVEMGSPEEHSRSRSIRSELVRLAIGANKPCPECGGGQFMYSIRRGELSGAVVNYGNVCFCWLWKQYWREMHRMTSARFVGVRLNRLKPEGPRLSKPQQDEIIATVRANRDKSCLLVGPAGRGKTHIATALFSHALERSIRAQLQRDPYGRYKPCVWRSEAGLLVTRTIDWDKRDREKENRLPMPVVRVCDIQLLPSWIRPVVVLDEVDKIAKSSYHLNVLLQLVDAVYERGGQVIMTSNTYPKALAALWGESYAGPILRRATDEPDGLMVSFNSTPSPQPPAPDNTGVEQDPFAVLGEGMV